MIRELVTTTLLLASLSLSCNRAPSPPPRLASTDAKGPLADAGSTNRLLGRSRPTTPRHLWKGRCALHPYVQELATDRYHVDPRIYAERTRLIAGTARIVPHYRMGRMRGFRLHAVRPSSVWSALGLRNGDVVEAIDGRPFSSPAAAFETVSRAWARKKIQLAVRHRGQSTARTITIEVAPISHRLAPCTPRPTTPRPTTPRPTTPRPTTPRPLADPR
ncbi:MAG: hypothetical protein KC609_20325 [Myxococcales bacterium]|nr:hypothetical protein [Myxococcales bacterium]